MEKILTPIEISNSMIESSIKKANGTFLRTLLLGIMAGMFIALGSVAAIVIWSAPGDIVIKKYLGAAVFPIGIILVVIAGSQLFTGNCVMTLGLLVKKIKFTDIIKNWIAVYIGNLIGSVFIVFLIYKSNLWVNTANAETLINIGIKKVHLDFSTLLYRGILCNIIVVLAVWIATGSSTMIGKIAALWFPVSVFVISGYEHSIANMFFIPGAMIHGANITVIELIHNLLPVTIGNIIGGGVIIPLMYYFINYAKKDH